MVTRVWVPSAKTERKKFVLLGCSRRGSSYPKRLKGHGGMNQVQSHILKGKGAHPLTLPWTPGLF